MQASTKINFLYMSERLPKQAKKFVELTSGRGVKAALARHLRIENLSILNNWKFRGVPAEYAFASAAFLKCKPEDICINWVAANAAPQAMAEPVATTERAYAKLIIEECVNAPDEKLKVVLGILNGTVKFPAEPTSQPSFNAVSDLFERYWKAGSDKAKKEIQLEIGGRVIQMFDQRQRPGEPPDGEERRRDGSKG